MGSDCISSWSLLIFLLYENSRGAPKLRLVRLIKISVNWSIMATKTIIDLRYLTINYQIHISCQLFSTLKIKLFLKVLLQTIKFAIGSAQTPF